MDRVGISCNEYCNKTIKWKASRSESFISDIHGRDHFSQATIGFDNNYKIKALKVDKLANELASLAPETMKFGLEAYEKQDAKSFDDALPYLKEQIEKCFKGEDAKEGISAFLEKRKPNWD